MAKTAMISTDEYRKHKIIGISVISVIALVLVAILVISLVLSAGGTVMDNGDLMKKINAGRKGRGEISEEFKKTYSGYCLDTIENYTDNEENVAFSLTNAMSATAFLTYGAAGDTAKELKKVLGTDAIDAGKNLSKIEKCIEYNEKKSSGLKFSSTAWLNNSALFAVNKSFLKTNGKYFGLGVYRDSFAKITTANKAQKNVVNATNGNTFPNVSFEQTQYMNIVSGSSFVAKWKTQASEADTEENLFKGSISEQMTSFFKTVESKYLAAATYAGIIKDFDGDFSFVAIAPKRIDEVTGYYGINEVLEEIRHNGTFLDFNKAAKKRKVAVMLPNYSNSVNIPTTTDLSTALKAKNVNEVFKKTADMRNIADDSLNLHLDSFVTSGDISITPAGCCSASSEGKSIDSKEFDEAENMVTFDHKFIYFIVDNNSGLPVYFGILNQIV